MRFLLVVVFDGDLRAVVLFAGRRAAVVRLRPVVFRRAVDFFRPAVFFLPVDFRAVVFLLAVVFFRAAGFLPVVFLRAVVFLAVVFLRAVDFFRAVAMCHLPPTLRTPCASGVVVPVRSCLPTLRIARRDAARS